MCKAERAGERPARPGIYHSDGGQALPLALVALAAGLILVTGLILAAGVHLQLSNNSVSTLQSYYAADAGVEAALAPLISNPTLYRSVQNLSLSLNGRTVNTTVVPAGTSITFSAGPSGPITSTITSYALSSTAGDVTLYVHADASQIEGQPTVAVRITAYLPGR